MSDSDKVKLLLNIGNQRISLTVPEAKKDFVRATENDVDSLYHKWKREFPAKSDREVLAMVAYQYASFYSELKRRYDDASQLAEECLQIASPSASKADEEDDSQLH